MTWRATFVGPYDVVLARYKEDVTWAQEETAAIGLELYVYQSSDPAVGTSR